MHRRPWPFQRALRVLYVSHAQQWSVPHWQHDRRSGCGRRFYVGAQHAEGTMPCQGQCCKCVCDSTVSKVGSVITCGRRMQTSRHDVEAWPINCGHRGAPLVECNLKYPTVTPRLGVRQRPALQFACIGWSYWQPEPEVTGWLARGVHGLWCKPCLEEAAQWVFVLVWCVIRPTAPG